MFFFTYNLPSLLFDLVNLEIHASLYVMDFELNS